MKATSEMDLKQKEEDMERQALLAEQRREDERLLQEEREREELERAKAAEGTWKQCFFHLRGQAVHWQERFQKPDEMHTEELAFIPSLLQLHKDA